MTPTAIANVAQEGGRIIGRQGNDFIMLVPASYIEKRRAWARMNKIKAKARKAAARAQLEAESGTPSPTLDKPASEPV